MDRPPPAPGAPHATDEAAKAPTLAEASRLWLKVGLLGFGGPAGQIALMHRLVIDDKKWLDETRFLHALNYCMLLPGPEAQQLAVYVGWLLHGVRGGLVAGLLFILPGALVMLALSIFYVRYGHLPGVQGALVGLQAAVLAIVIDALARIGSRALGSAPAIGIAVTAFIAIFFLRASFPLIIAAAALAGLLMASPSSPPTRPELRPVKTRRRFLLRTIAIGGALWVLPTVLVGLIPWLSPTFADIGVFFSKMAVVTFGGAYAVLAYVAQQAVEAYGWLAPGEMLTGLGLAETTPGPLIMVVQFVGFLAAYRDPGALAPMSAGILGAALTVWVTFVPCFIWIFLGAPYLERLRGNRRLAGTMRAITAAVVGVIANLALWFALHVLFAQIDERQAGPIHLLVPRLASVDPVSASIAAASLVAILVLRVHMLVVLAAAAGAGVVHALILS